MFNPTRKIERLAWQFAQNVNVEGFKSLVQGYLDARNVDSQKEDIDSEIRETFYLLKNKRYNGHKKHKKHKMDTEYWSQVIDYLASIKS